MYHKIHLMVASSLLKNSKIRNKIITARKRSLGQGNIYTCLSFCSRGGGGGGLPGQVHPSPLGRYTPREGTPPRQIHPSPEQCMLGYTGNKWAVRNLLECILVWRCNTGMNVFVNFLEMHSLRFPSAQASSGRFFSSVIVGTIIIFR